VVADEVDDRRMRPPRVVQVGDPVGEARTQVRERECRAPGDAGEAVGSAGRDTLEQRKHGPHVRGPIQRGDQFHLGRARVREARVDADQGRGLKQGVGAVHRREP
jgi:hypothetical protein